jgi:hypothetical protein
MSSNGKIFVKLPGRKMEMVMTILEAQAPPGGWAALEALSGIATGKIGG